MPTTQIRGTLQIQAGTIIDAQISGAAAIATSKLADYLNFIFKDGSRAFAADQSHGGFRITNLADPVNLQDAATRNWVLSQMATIVSSSLTARVATTANITLSGTANVIDGITMNVVDQTVLAKNQTNAAENGMYHVKVGVWTRVPGMDVWTEVPGALVTVQEGTVNHDTLWLSAADVGGTLGTTAITFTQIPGPSDVQAGAGMLRTGNVLDVVAGDNSLLVSADSLIVLRNAAGGVGLGASGLEINLDAATTKIVAPSNVAVKLDPARAITTSGTVGIGVNIDTTLQIVSNILGVKPGQFVGTASFVVRETPAGLINGSNVTFTLAFVPNPVGSEQIYFNGLLQDGGGNDYTISGQTITMVVAPPTGSIIRASYMK
jgi:hypothetical protein